MSEMRRFTLTINGLTAMIMHNNAGLLAPPEDKGRDKLAWEREHMREMAYLNTAGELIVPSRAIRKCLISGCRFVTDKPKGAGFKSFGPLIEATLFVEADAVLFVSADKLIEYIAVVNLDPSKGDRGPRGPRCRPMVPMPWAAETTIALIDDAVTDAHLEKIADMAGRLCGLLDGRKIGFGRCEMSIERV
jgi:hypothetical protein